MRNQFYDTKALLIISIAIALIVGLLSLVVPSSFVVAIGFAATIFVVLLAIGKAVRLVRRQQDNVYTQLECFQQLHSALNPVAPIPGMRGYAGSPDFLLWLHREIKRNKPQTIVEASSGVSSIVSGYTLEQLGNGGKVYSLENNSFYAQITRNNLSEHGLEKTVTIFDAPLVQHQINGESHKWYEFAKAELPESIDLMVIDGPPRRTQPLARYPALPLLKERLSPNAVILVDDADRADERAMVKRWQSEFPTATVDRLPCEKGLVIIRLGGSS
ncbi:MAG: class I SAM-dependent methyltransferase [Gammaproteobacteria bacterium]|nr:class I SAM-dependent methyltransferase [Gammaproteobacteria bacterium]